MVEHFLANLMLLWDDPAPYHWYTETLGHSVFVRGLEVALFALFLLHIGIGIVMRVQHQRMLRNNPRAPRPKDFATKYVGYTGAFILIFLVVHLLKFFVPNRVRALKSSTSTNRHTLHLRPGGTPCSMWSAWQPWHST